MVTKAKTPPEPRLVAKVVNTESNSADPVQGLRHLGLDDIAGDRGVEDFRKWIVNFAHQDSGHFTSVEASEDFARQVLNYIEVDGFIGEIPSADKPKRNR